MCETEFTIEILKNDFKTLLSEDDLKNAIFVEKGDEFHYLSKITVRGKYCREYTVASFISELTPTRVLLDGELLLVLLWSELAVIDLEQNKLLRVIDFESWELFGIYKFKSGYFIHGEDSTRYLDDNFNLLWEEGCVDAFANIKVDNEVKIFDYYWTIIDWCGYNHYYDENGEFMHPLLPQYDCNKNDK